MSNAINNNPTSGFGIDDVTKFHNKNVETINLQRKTRIWYRNIVLSSSIVLAAAFAACITFLKIKLDLAITSSIITGLEVKLFLIVYSCDKRIKKNEDDIKILNTSFAKIAMKIYSGHPTEQAIDDYGIAAQKINTEEEKIPFWVKLVISWLRQRFKVS